MVQGWKHNKCRSLDHSKFQSTNKIILSGREQKTPILDRAVNEPSRS